MSKIDHVGQAGIFANVGSKIFKSWLPVSEKRQGPFRVRGDIPKHPWRRTEIRTPKTDCHFSRTHRPNWHINRENQDLHASRPSPVHQIERKAMIVSTATVKLKPKDVWGDFCNGFNCRSSNQPKGIWHTMLLGRFG